MEQARRASSDTVQRQRLRLSTEAAADKERRPKFTVSPLVQVLALALLVSLHSCCPTAVDAPSRIPFATSRVIRTQHTLDMRKSPFLSIARGGATIADDEGEKEEEDENEDENENEEDTDNDDSIRQHPDYAKLQAYRMQQQTLLQLRATELSEALALRGLPIPSMESASTPVGATPPKKVDWDCALSTKDKKLTCMYTFDDEYGTKFIAPIDPKRGEPLSDEWITVAALNRLRRNDRSKVLKMWHDKYAILDSWFTADSEYSVLQHVGPEGILLNFLLDDLILTVVVAIGVTFLTLLFLPLLEMIAIRFLVSGTLWMRWISWGRFVHLGLPFKLMVGSWLLKTMLSGFAYVKGKVKEALVELECENMADSLPLTLGVPTLAHVDEGEAEILDEEDEIMEHLVEEESGDSDEEASAEESDSDD